MKRRYVKVKEYEEMIFDMKVADKSNREIREYFGLSEKQLENLINRYNRRKDKIEAGIELREKGRPRKDNLITDNEKDYIIKRLKMENELLRDFIRLAGRR